MSPAAGAGWRDGVRHSLVFGNRHLGAIDGNRWSAIGENVRRLRERAAMSQSKLARCASVHVTYLSGVENGRRSPTLEVIGRIADSLGVRPQDLLI